MAKAIFKLQVVLIDVGAQQQSRGLVLSATFLLESRLEYEVTMQKFSHFFKGLYLISKLSTIINNKINILTMYCSISYMNNTLFLSYSSSLTLSKYPTILCSLFLLAVGI